MDLRISRPCYDKYHRCPGWAGGGTKWARVQKCYTGYIDVDYSRRAWKWRTHRCASCGVIVLPYVVRWLDLGWWRWMVLR